MNRTLKRAAVLLTVAGIGCLPVTAVADQRPIVFDNATTSIVSGDVFGAGHSNIVGSGDGGGAADGLGAAAPTGERRVRIQTRADEVTLVSHTGDAPFPQFLPFFSTAIVPYSGVSAAVYHGRDSDYRVDLPANDFLPSCVATTPQSRCEVTIDRGDVVITMG